MKRLIAGPWVGEFGWELFCWQAFVRSIARGYDQVRIITRPSSIPLYEFADDCIPFIPENGYAESNRWIGEATGISQMAAEMFLKKGADDTLLLPENYFYWGNPLEIAQHGVVTPSFVSYGVPSEGAYDVLLCSRQRDLKPSGNWHRMSWGILAHDLKHLHAASIGTRDEAYHVPGTVDLRGLPLNHLMNIMASAKLAIGPSTGSLHLAALCRCPRVVWYCEDDTAKDHPRYLTHWNPFAVPTTIMPQLNPTAEEVRDHIFDHHPDLRP